jgi:hypothetical protein
VHGAGAFPIDAIASPRLMSRSSVRPLGLQNLNLTCSSNLRLSADSENPVPPSDPAPYGWFARPNSGEVTLPMIGPGLS